MKKEREGKFLCMCPWRIRKENERSISQLIIRTILHSRNLSNGHENVKKQEEKKFFWLIAQQECEISLSFQEERMNVLIIALDRFYFCHCWSHYISQWNVNYVFISNEKSIDQSRKEDIKNDLCALSLRFFSVAGREWSEMSWYYSFE